MRVVGAHYPIPLAGDNYKEQLAYQPFFLLESVDGEKKNLRTGILSDTGLRISIYPDFTGLCRELRIIYYVPVRIFDEIVPVITRI